MPSSSSFLSSLRGAGACGHLRHRVLLPIRLCHPLQLHWSSYSSYRTLSHFPDFLQNHYRRHCTQQAQLHTWSAGGKVTALQGEVTVKHSALFILKLLHSHCSHGPRCPLHCLSLASLVWKVSRLHGFCGLSMGLEFQSSESPQKPCR